MDKGITKNKLINLSNEIKRKFGKELSEVGISYQQCMLLKTIMNYGRPVSGKELTDVLNSDKATISNMIKLLIKDGFLIETRDEKDRRIKNVQIASKVLPLCSIVAKSEQEFLSKLFKGIDKKELEVFNTILDKINKNLG